jgi:chromosome segregation ATPase
MSDDITASQILETQLREARAEAAGYRAHNDALQLQVVELNGELAALETATKTLTDEGIDAVRQLKAVLASHAELVAVVAALRFEGRQLQWVLTSAMATSRGLNVATALANARKAVAP